MDGRIRERKCGRAVYLLQDAAVTIIFTRKDERKKNQKQKNGLHYVFGYHVVKVLNCRKCPKLDIYFFRVLLLVV